MENLKNNDFNAYKSLIFIGLDYTSNLVKDVSAEHTCQEKVDYTRQEAEFLHLTEKHGVSLDLVISEIDGIFDNRGRGKIA